MPSDVCQSLRASRARRSGRWCALIIHSVAALWCSAQPSITEIPILSGTFNAGHANAISADGRVVVGWSGIAGSSPGIYQNPRAVSWSTDGGLVDLGGTPFSLARAVSADGAVVAGDDISDPFRWTQSTGRVLIPNAPGINVARAVGISRDGFVLAGSLSGTNGAFRWSAATGTVFLPAPVSISPTALSANGDVLIGNEFSGFYRWVGTSSPQLVSSNATGWSVRADGRMLGGTLGSAAAIWHYNEVSDDEPAATTVLGVLPGPFPESCWARVTGISDDGLTVVGAGTTYQEGLPSSQFPLSAALWRPGLGLVNLNTYLPARGLDLTGWHLRLASGISADGSVIAGTGTRNGQVRAFVVHLPPLCGTADFDNDGDTATDADIEAFFACLAGNCCATCWHLGPDFNGDGDSGTDADIEAFFRVLAGQDC
jgi:uncharacterized membrane protein